MPVRYTIDPHHRAVVIEIRGELTLAEVIETAQKLRREPFFQLDFASVVDLSEAQRVELDADAISSFVHGGHDPFKPGTRRAIIATRPDTYGIARMYQGVSDDLNIFIFRSRDEAMAWLAQTPVNKG
jgi:hypothetical protein